MKAGVRQAYENLDARRNQEELPGETDVHGAHVTRESPNHRIES